MRVCSSDKMIPISRVSVASSLKMLLNTFMYFFRHFFGAFHHKICVFVIFISFSDKVSHFHNRILTNQKLELMVSNCQQNCMIRVASRVAERLKTYDLRKLGNIRKNSKPHRMIA